MKKYLWIFSILVIIIGVCIFAFNKNNEDSGESYIAERTSINNENSIENIESEKVEEKISEFSTRLPNDTKARDDNIKLACKTINGVIVNSGETFSFWDTLGCPTKEKGYQEAKTFTSDGEVTESYGGGVCQISTTIYNAVLKVEGLKVTERHEHSREVSYIEDGKDAAVSYGNADLKFENTLNYDIKIEAEVKDREVKIRLVRI